MKAKSVNIGYLGYSKIKKTFEHDKKNVLAYMKRRNLGDIVFVNEDLSYKKNWKERRINKIMNRMKSDDNIVVFKISNLGKSTVEVLEILQEALERDVNILSVKEGFSLFESGIRENLETILNLVSSLEKEFRSGRIKEALVERKKRGIKLGRPKGPGKSKLDKHKNEIIRLLRNGSTKVYVARRYGTTLPNLYNWLKKQGIDVKPVVDLKV